MKLIATLLDILTFGLLANATVITVSNTPNSPAQYTDLQTAINAATAGDTLYVNGSSVHYGTIYIGKQLVIIGAGFNPQKQFPLVSTIGRIQLNTTGAGTVIEGFAIFDNDNSPVNHCNDLSFASRTVYSPDCVNNIIIRKCNLSGYVQIGGANWLIENNLIDNLNVSNNFNSIINNNIFRGSLFSSAQANVQISNNLFFGGGSYGTDQISNANFTNNIFYGAHPTNVSNSVFNNNLTFNTNQNALPYGTNTGSGNIDNQDPQFTSIQTLNYTFSFFDDYRLLPTSPGHNAGTDGTDIGPFGGSSPFPSSPIGGEPKIPQVKNMNLSNTTYPLNGNINLNVKGKKQD